MFFKKILKNLGLIIPIAILLFGLNCLAEAKLAYTNFKDLIVDSDYIFKAKVQEVHKIDKTTNFKGYAIFKIVNVVKGKDEGRTVRIGWSPEVHDQRIHNVGDLYYLFLRENDSQYKATHYGRSYFLITNATKIAWGYPYDMIRLGEYQNKLKPCTTPKTGGNCLLVSDLDELIKEVTSNSCSFNQLHFKDLIIDGRRFIPKYFGDEEDVYIVWGRHDHPIRSGNKSTLIMFRCANRKLERHESFSFPGKKVEWINNYGYLYVNGDGFSANITCEDKSKRYKCNQSSYSSDE